MLPKFLVYGKLELLIYSVIAIVSVSVSVYIYLAQYHDPPVPPPIAHETLALNAAPAFNKLAVLDDDRQLWLLDPESEDRKRISVAGQRCGTPVWSRDGSYLAYVEYLRGELRAIRAVATEDGRRFTLFEPRYQRFSLLNWSPDGRYLAYTNRSSKGRFTILLGVAPEAPSFWLAEDDVDAVQWSSDSKSLLFAHREELHRIRVAKDLETLDVIPTNGLIESAAWAPGEDQFFQVVSGDDATYLGTNQDGGENGYTIPVTHPLTMATSPDQKYLAFLEHQSKTPYRRSGPVTVVPLSGGGSPVSFPFEADVFFWSPDSKQLAILTDDKGGASAVADRVVLPRNSHPEERLKWWILNLDTGDYYPLVTFNAPSSYERLLENEAECPGSYQVWDPSGARIVLSSTEAGEAPSEVWIVDVAGIAPPKQMGEGAMAMWSWQ